MQYSSGFLEVIAGRILTEDLIMYTVLYIKCPLITIRLHWLCNQYTFTASY